MCHSAPLRVFRESPQVSMCRSVSLGAPRKSPRALMCHNGPLRATREPPRFPMCHCYYCCCYYSTSPALACTTSLHQGSGVIASVAGVVRGQGANENPLFCVFGLGVPCCVVAGIFAVVVLVVTQLPRSHLRRGLAEIPVPTRQGPGGRRHFNSDSEGALNKNYHSPDTPSHAH